MHVCDTVHGCVKKAKVVSYREGENSLHIDINRNERFFQDCLQTPYVKKEALIPVIYM